MTYQPHPDDSNRLDTAKLAVEWVNELHDEHADLVNRLRRMDAPDSVIEHLERAAPHLADAASRAVIERNHLELREARKGAA